jgi:Na+/H+ antiporter NhaD/arsenite permease-like protein
MLASLALGPLWFPHWWEPNRNKLIVAAVAGAPVLVLYLLREPHALLHAAVEYASFVILLAGLYIVAGGIRLEGDLEATPLTNATFLALGAVLASFIGTTGASMLLIRPLLQTNQERTAVRHTVVFFIFLVANVGGMLTPLGDPPLFLGYLEGVPFAWTLRLALPWAFLTASLLVIYVVWDRRVYAREPASALRRDATQRAPLRVLGGYNAVFLIGVVLAVAFLGAPWREVVIVACAAVSFAVTPRRIHRDNGFTPHAMVEVAALFAGIFLTMIPALEILRARGAELGLREPWQYFWATGLLSSVLDNAPTYLTFVALGQGADLPREVIGVSHAVLEAISVGAVAMGANTYIGNAPNFMVKALAERAGVTMPSFFGYLCYSGGVLVPLFVLATLLFF